MFGISTVGGLAGGGDGTPGVAPILALSDPFWESVVLFSKMNADPPIDRSISNHTITDGGAGATLDASNQRFGGGCRDYDGSSTGLDGLGDSADWHFGTGDYTIELWVNWNDLGSSGFMNPIAQWDSTGDQRGWILSYDETTGEITFSHSTDGTDNTGVLTFDLDPVIGRWYNIAITRSNGIGRMFVNGELVDVIADTDDYHNSTVELKIASNENTGTEFDGKVDEVRITKGIDRYG